jgi:uncharacterized protein YlxW (UPF0749 family)
MNPFLSRFTGTDWVLPVSSLALILGVMMSLAWLRGETAQERIRGLDPQQQQRILTPSIDMIEEYGKLTTEVQKLRADKTRLENAMGEGTKQTQVLNDSLQEAKVFAGLTEVEGTGIVVTLRDDPNATNTGIGGQDDIIHDTDVLKVVNELWAAGAEAIAVNKHRIVASSSFRCVGPVIHVDNVPISSPVRIQALGDPDTLASAMSLPLGVIAEIRQTGDPSMAVVEKVQKQRLPAFNGSTARRHAAPVKEGK